MSVDQHCQATTIGDMQLLVPWHGRTGIALSKWPTIGKGKLGEKLCESGAHPVVGAGVDEDFDHINLVLPCCQMEGCGAILQGSKAALMHALRKRLLGVSWHASKCLSDQTDIL